MVHKLTHEKLSPPPASCFIFFIGELANERVSVVGLLTCGFVLTAVVGSTKKKKNHQQMKNNSNNQ